LIRKSVKNKLTALVT